MGVSPQSSPKFCPVVKVFRGFDQGVLRPVEIKGGDLPYKTTSGMERGHPQTTVTGSGVLGAPLPHSCPGH